MENQRSSKILDLLYGNLFTYTERIKYDEKCIKSIDKLIIAEKAMVEKIKDDAELIKLFDEFQQSVAVKEISETDLYFTEGFKTGLLIGIEAGEWAAEKINK